MPKHDPPGVVIGKNTNRTLILSPKSLSTNRDLESPLHVPYRTTSCAAEARRVSTYSRVCRSQSRIDSNENLTVSVPSRYMTAASFGYVEETHSAKGSHICRSNL